MYPGTVQPQSPTPLGSWGTGAEHGDQQAQFMQRVLSNFGFSLLMAAGGAYAGWSLPPAAYLGLILVEFVLLMAAMFVRRSATASPFLVYAFAAVSGATTVPLIKWAIGYTQGTAVVYNALGATGAIFCAMSWYGMTTKRDLSGWGTFLMMGLIGACIASFIGLFITHTPVYQLMISAVVTIVMTGFIGYDINQVKRNWQAYDINVATLTLYLDFLNLFVHLLRIMAMLSGGGSSRDWE